MTARRLLPWVGCTIIAVCIVAAVAPVLKEQAYVTHEALHAWHHDSPRCQLWRGRLGNNLFHYWHARLEAKYSARPLHCAWQVPKPFHLLPVELPRGADGAATADEARRYESTCGRINEVHFYERPGAFRCLADDMDMIITTTRAAFLRALAASSHGLDFYHGRLPEVEPGTGVTAVKGAGASTQVLRGRRATHLQAALLAGPAVRSTFVGERWPAGAAAAPDAGPVSHGIRVMIHYRCGDLWGKTSETERFFLPPQYYVAALHKAQAAAGPIGTVHIVREPSEPSQCSAMESLLAMQIAATFPRAQVFAAGSSLLHDTASMVGADVFVASISTLSYWVAIVRGHRPSVVPSDFYLDQAWVGLCPGCLVQEVTCRFSLANLYYHEQDLPRLYSSGCAPEYGCKEGGCAMALS